MDDATVLELLKLLALKVLSNPVALSAAVAGVSVICAIVYCDPTTDHVIVHFPVRTASSSTQTPMDLDQMD